MNRRTTPLWIAIAVCGLFAACSKNASGSGSQPENAAGAAVGAAGSSASAAASGVSCDKYCSLAVGGMCTGSLQLYANAAACQAGCAMIPTLGTANDMGGNTLGCRIYHLTLANMSAANAATHCPHGAVASPVCK